MIVYVLTHEDDLLCTEVFTTKWKAIEAIIWHLKEDDFIIDISTETEIVDEILQAEKDADLTNKKYAILYDSDDFPYTLQRITANEIG